jgi:hypothetical protein
MRNSLQKRLSRKGWTGKQLSAFFKKHGIIRSWKTILEEIKNSKRVFLVEKVSGYVILPNDTVKKYLSFIIGTKKIKKIDGTLANPKELIESINMETKEQVDEGVREEKNKNEIYIGEFVSPFGSVEDRILVRQGLIKTIRKF